MYNFYDIYKKRFKILILISFLIVFYIVIINKNKEHFKIITPQCVYGAMTSASNILIVNVLSEKMPIFIGLNKFDSRSISKNEFENIIEKNNGRIPKNIDLVILMCAGWSCGAAEGYFHELSQRGINTKNVVDYAGGIHEWCLYSKMNNSIFKVFNVNNIELSENELNEILRGTAHSYKNNTLIESEPGLYTNYCKLGNDLPNLIV